jgi:hypothetical protein
MPYDPRTGRMITDEQAERLAEEAGRPAPPPRPEAEPTVGDRFTSGVRTALDVIHRMQGMAAGQEPWPWESRVDFSQPPAEGEFWKTIHQRALASSVPLVLQQHGLQQFAMPPLPRKTTAEILDIPLRVPRGVVAAGGEALRRLRMDEAQASPGYYGREFARHVLHNQEGSVLNLIEPPWGPRALLKGAAPSLFEAPETDLFTIGEELARGPHISEPRWWSLAAGEAFTYAPILPLLAFSYGPGTRGSMQRIGARAATRATSGLRRLRFAEEEAFGRVSDAQFIESGFTKRVLPDEAWQSWDVVGPKVHGALRSAVDRWWGERANIGANLRKARDQGRTVLPEEVSSQLAEVTGRMHEEVTTALRDAGLGATTADAAATLFGNEVAWGTATGVRFLGLRLGRRPNPRGIGERLRTSGVTTTGASVAEMRGVRGDPGLLDDLFDRGAITRTMEDLGIVSRTPDPVYSEAPYSRIVQDVEYYTRSSRRARQLLDADALEVLRETEAQPKWAAETQVEVNLRNSRIALAAEVRAKQEALAELEAAVERQAPAEAPVPTLPTDLPAGAFGRGTVTPGVRGDVGALADVAGRFGLERPEASLLEPMEPPAAPAQQVPVVQALEQTYGTTTDAADAAFLLPDGRMIRRRPGLAAWAHHEMLREVTGKPSFEGVANETGMVRMGIDVDPASGSRALRVEMWSKPTEQQIRALQQAAKEADRIDVDMRGGVRAEADWSADPVLPTSMVDLSRAIEEFWPAAPAQQEAPGASASVVEGTSLPPAPEEAPRGAQAAQPTPEQAEAPATETQLLHMTQEEFAARPPEGYTWRPGKRNEASRKTDESGQPYTELGPKFFELDPDVRADILEHEGGHDLDTLWLDAGIDALGWQLLEQNALDDMVNKPNYPEGERIPGETWHLYGGNRTPGEAIADAYRDYLRRPEEFRKRATPQLQEAMASYFAEYQQQAQAAQPTPEQAEAPAEEPVYVQTDRQMLDELLRKRDNAQARRRKAQARLAKLKADRERRGAQGATGMARARAKRTEAEYERRKDRAFSEETSLTKLIEDLQRRVSSYEKSVEAPAPTARDLTGQHKTRTWPHMYVHNKMGWWQDAAWQIGNALPEGAEFAMLPEEELPTYTLAALVTSEPLPADFAFDLGLKEMDAPPEYPDEYEEAPAALPQPGERVVMREARTGREEVGQVLADPETGEPWVFAATDGTPVVNFERDNGTVTAVPWVADPAIVSFEQAPQEAPSAREQLGIPDAPPVLTDDAARAAVSRNIRTLNAALDHVLPQLARMVEVHPADAPEHINALQIQRMARSARAARFVTDGALPAEGQPNFDAIYARAEELLAEVAEARATGEQLRAEDELADVMAVARALDDNLYNALVTQGIPQADAEAAGKRAAAGYLLLHQDVLDRVNHAEDAAEGSAAVQANLSPQTVEDLQCLMALKQEALTQALGILGSEMQPPTLEQFTLASEEGEATPREQAQAMLDDAEVLPGEHPVETIIREAAEQVGGVADEATRSLAREAEAERLRIEIERDMAELDRLTEGSATYPDTKAAEFERLTNYKAEQRRRAGVRDAAHQQWERLKDVWQRKDLYFLKHPGVRKDKTVGLMKLETRTLGLIEQVKKRAIAIFQRPHGEMPLTDEELYAVTDLLTLRQAGGTVQEQLQSVLGPAVAEAVVEQGAIAPDGTINTSALPKTERRIFEVADELRELFDDLYWGRKGFPSFKQLAERLYDYRRFGQKALEEAPARPEPVPGYFPQPDLAPRSPDDLAWLMDTLQLGRMAATATAPLGGAAQLNEEGLGPQVHDRYSLELGQLREQEGRHARRPDITRRRRHRTRAEHDEAKIEQGERDIDAGVAEPNILVATIYYIHNFGALHTAVNVYEWIHENAATRMDVEFDPALGPEVLGDLLRRGWGPPRPYGIELAGTEDFVLPPEEQGVINGIVAKGTLPSIFSHHFARKILAPMRDIFWAMTWVPLQTLTFWTTQAVELGSTMLFTGAAAKLPALAAGFAVATRIYARDIIGLAETCHPTTWLAEQKLLHARAQEKLWAALTKHLKLDEATLAALKQGAQDFNLTEGSVSAAQHEQLEKLLSAFNLHKKEIDAIWHGMTGFVFGIDSFARMWAFCSLVAQGHSMDEAGKLVRENSANYDVRSPWYELLSNIAFYSTWLMQRAEQFGSLAYKRPAILYIFAQSDEDKERFMGFSAGWQPLVEAGLWWGIDDPTLFPVKRTHPMVREIGDFLATTKFLEEKNGYQLFYAPFRLPLLDFGSTVQGITQDPFGEVGRMSVPVVRMIQEAASGNADANDLLKQVPGVGPWVRASERTPWETWLRLTLNVGPMQMLVDDPPLSFWEGVVNEERTPEYARANAGDWKKAQRLLDMGVPRSQTDAGQYEVEMMQFLYLLEKGKRRYGVPIYAGNVPDAVNKLTPEGAERVIEAIDAGEWIVSRPSETPQQFRKRLEEELAQRRPEEAGKAPVGPMTPDEQRGGIAATVSRMLRPVTMEGVTP